VSRPWERSTAGPVSYTLLARSRSESTSQFTALNKPSSSSSSSSAGTTRALPADLHRRDNRPHVSPVFAQAV